MRFFFLDLKRFYISYKKLSRIIPDAFVPFQTARSVHMWTSFKTDLVHFQCNQRSSHCPSRTPTGLLDMRMYDRGSSNFRLSCDVFCSPWLSFFCSCRPVRSAYTSLNIFFITVSLIPISIREDVSCMTYRKEFILPNLCVQYLYGHWPMNIANGIE